jgi:hypothetical protein
MRSLNQNPAFVIAEHEAVPDPLRSHNWLEARKLTTHVVHSGEAPIAYLVAREFWKP